MKTLKTELGDTLNELVEILFISFIIGVLFLGFYFVTGFYPFIGLIAFAGIFFTFALISFIYNLIQYNKQNGKQ